MKINDAYKAVFHGLAAMRSGWDYFIYRDPNANGKRITKIFGTTWRDLINARQEIFYPSEDDIMADDWHILDFKFELVAGYVIKNKEEE